MWQIMLVVRLLVFTPLLIFVWHRLQITILLPSALSSKKRKTEEHLPLGKGDLRKGVLRGTVARLFGDARLLPFATPLPLPACCCAAYPSASVLLSSLGFPPS